MHALNTHIILLWIALYLKEQKYASVKNLTVNVLLPYLNSFLVHKSNYKRTCAELETIPHAIKIHNYFRQSNNLQ